MPSDLGFTPRVHTSDSHLGFIRSVSRRWTRRRLPARVRVLPGTSGPWVELTIELTASSNGGELTAKGGGGGAAWASVASAPRGQWVLVRAVPLGKERHPLSLTLRCDLP